MEHIRIDPKFRRRPRPKRAGWAAREVFKFLLEVSAEFDLRGRFPTSMQDVEWLAEEWANGDTEAMPGCAVMLAESLGRLREVGLTHVDGEALVITDWEDFYKPVLSNAERQTRHRHKGRPVTEVTAPVTNNESNARNESNATQQHSTALHSTALNVEAERTAPPVDAVAAPGALTVRAVVAGAQPERRGVARVSPPDSPPEGWEGMDFWRWAQDRRQATGYMPERPPHPRKLSGWWSEARGVVPQVQRLKDAFYRFGEDDYWRATDPPYPFHGFMSQWERFVPPEEDAHAA